MFDRVSETAEKLVTNVSRRAFMGRLGKGALTLAGAVGAMLAFPCLVQAGQGCPCGSQGVITGSWCCTYACSDGSTITTRTNAPNCGCKPQYKGCALQQKFCYSV
jgi:hypothetical protein